MCVLYLSCLFLCSVLVSSSRFYAEWIIAHLQIDSVIYSDMNSLEDAWGRVCWVSLPFLFSYLVMGASYSFFQHSLLAIWFAHRNSKWHLMPSCSLSSISCAILQFLYVDWVSQWTICFHWSICAPDSSLEQSIIICFKTFISPKHFYFWIYQPQMEICIWPIIWGSKNELSVTCHLDHFLK